LGALHHGIAEAGIVLAADGIEGLRAIRRAEADDGIQHGGIVAARPIEGLVEGAADLALVISAAAEGEGVLRHRQREEDVVGVVAQRRRQEGEVAGDAGVGA
jgi:hypothetical protein